MTTSFRKRAPSAAPPAVDGTDPPAYIGAALLAVASLGVMANAAVAPGLPLLRDAFPDTPHIDTLIGLVVTLPSLGIVLTAAAAGWLNDRVGRLPVMLGALLLYGVAGLAGLVTQSLWALLATRFLLGVAIGGTMTSAMAMIADRYRGPGVVQFMSTQAVVMSAASMAFLVIGGVLAEFGWRHPFLVYAAGFVMVPVALWVLGESKPAGTLSGARDRLDLTPFLIVGITAMLAMIFYYLLPIRLPFRLKALGYMSTTTAGLTVAASTLAMACAAMTYARTGARLSPPLVYASIFASMAAGFGLIAWSTSLMGIVVGAALAGAGNGWLFPANNLVIARRAAAHQRGRASGFHTTCIFLGQFLSPLVSAPIIERSSTGAAFAAFGMLAAVVAFVFFVLAWREHARL